MFIGKLPRVSSLRARQAAAVAKPPRRPSPQPENVSIAVGGVENGTSGAGTGTTTPKQPTPGVQPRKRGRPPKNRGISKIARVEQRAEPVEETEVDAQGPLAINGTVQENNNHNNNGKIHCK